MSDILGSGGIELQPAISSGEHGHIGAGLSVDLPDDVGNGPRQILLRKDMMGLYRYRLHVPTGKGHGRGDHGAGRPIVVLLAIGASSPGRDGVGSSLALGGRRPELGEELMRLGVEGGLLLLSGRLGIARCLLRRGRGVAGAGAGGRGFGLLRGGGFDVGLVGDGVLLGHPFGSRHFGSHNFG